LEGIQPLFVPFCFTILSYVVRGSYGCFNGSVGLDLGLHGSKKGSSLYHCQGNYLWVWKQKQQNKIGRMLHVTKKHVKDVLDVEVKRNIPQDVGLHFVAHCMLHDMDWPSTEQVISFQLPPSLPSLTVAM
jgi:hypothetical protein